MGLLILDDRGDLLTEKEMLRISKEINFPECAFIRARDVRIFTADEEIPQAEHSMVGVAEIVAGVGNTATLTTQKGFATLRREEGNGKTGKWLISQDTAEWLGQVTVLDLDGLMRNSLDSFVG